jgi:hypothetical protein
MVTAKMIAGEIDIHAFQAGIFLSDADLFSPVVIYSGVFKNQFLEDFDAEIKTHPSKWMAYAGPAGIGQYSLKRGKPAGVLAKWITHFRTPTAEEKHHDFEFFGEQVMGPKVDEASKKEIEENKHNSIFKVFGENYYFTGPPRILKSIFHTRVFPGEIPKDIFDLVRQVDESAKTDEMNVFQCYQFLHATDGKMLYLPFGDPKDYNPDNLDFYGAVEISNGEMNFYPRGDRENPIDFTETIKDM